MLKIKKINYNQDSGSVVELIQKYLDPNFTFKLFESKHLENPFGRSFGVVAFKNDVIIGVRMGLYWEFINHHLNRKIKSVRPVDTVVSREYRRQGVFTKMNQEFMKILEKEEYDLIFNTPNKKSLPANIRMGWEVLGNLNYYTIGILNPFRRVADFDEVPPPQINWKAGKNIEQYFHTNFVDNFFKWRYEGEFGKYKVASFNKENSNCVIYKYTFLKGLKVIIVYDLVGDEAVFSTMIKSLGKAHNCFFIYYVNNVNWNKVNFLVTFRRKKPNILLRNDRYAVGHQINFSAGDLEAVI